MNNLDLKKLSRAELLELLLVQTRENEKLRELLNKAQDKLNERRIRMDEVGDLANAVLVVNGVIEAAQLSASQYLENIRIMERETKAECEKIIEEARIEAEKIRRGGSVGILSDKPAAKNLQEEKEVDIVDINILCDEDICIDSYDKQLVQIEDTEVKTNQIIKQKDKKSYIRAEDQLLDMINDILINDGLN